MTDTPELPPLPEPLPEMKWQHYMYTADQLRAYAAEAVRVALSQQQPEVLWLWKNFVNGKPEYWAFDNPFPVHLDYGDPQTLGEPCGYAILKPSRAGRTDWTPEQVLARIKAAQKDHT